MSASQNNDDIKKDCIVIESYNESWPMMAEQEIKRIYNVISDDNLVDIQHIGSTSIPNAKAKPIIDIYIGVRSINLARKKYVEPIVTLGYVYWEENPNLEKLFFVKGMPPYGKKRTHHIHVVEYSSHYWRDKIVFRDYLKLHPEDVKRYDDLKVELASKHQYDREAYTDAKNNFIVQILKKAGIKDGGVR